jgi:hypothetical protein
MKKRISGFTVGVVLSLLVLTVSAYGSTSLNLPGTYGRFDFCPIANPEVGHCVYTMIDGGAITIGKKALPLVAPLILQLGTTRVHGEGAQVLHGSYFAHLLSVIAPTNGATMSKSAEPVAGGLQGLVPPASSTPAVKALTTYYSEHGAAGVTATPELAGPVSEMAISEYDLTVEELGVLYMPLKFHIENPFLGSSCYIGSNSTPIEFALSTGQTAGMAALPFQGPNRSIQGTSGLLSAEDEDRVILLSGTQLVGNQWAAPAVSGCGGTLAPIVDPLIDSVIGLPSPAGRNTAVLNKSILDLASAVAVKNMAEGQ